MKKRVKVLGNVFMVGVLVIGLVVSVMLVQERQRIRSKAASYTADLSFSSTNLIVVPGQPFTAPISVILNTDLSSTTPQPVVSGDILISFDQTLITLNSITVPSHPIFKTFLPVKSVTDHSFDSNKVIGCANGTILTNCPYGPGTIAIGFVAFDWAANSGNGALTGSFTGVINQLVSFGFSAKPAFASSSKISFIVNGNGTKNDSNLMTISAPGSYADILKTPVSLVTLKLAEPLTCASGQTLKVIAPCAQGTLNGTQQVRIYDITFLNSINSYTITQATFQGMGVDSASTNNFQLAYSDSCPSTLIGGTVSSSIAFPYSTTFLYYGQSSNPTGYPYLGSVVQRSSLNGKFLSLMAQTSAVTFGPETNLHMCVSGGAVATTMPTPTSTPILTPKPTLLPTSTPIQPTSTPTPILTPIPTKISTPTPIPTSGNLLINPSFESTGTAWVNPWFFDSKVAGAGTISQDSTTKADGLYSAKVNVVTAYSTTPWNVQLRQEGINFTANKTYTLTFWAQAETARTIEAKIQGVASPYTSYVTQSFPLTTTWQQFSLTYIPTINLTNVFVGFNMAQAVGKVWIDGVVFK